VAVSIPTRIDDRTVLDYLLLAEAAGSRERPFVRNRILSAALMVAWKANKPATAEACRRSIIAQNPGHLLNHWTNVADAVVDDEFIHLAEAMGRKYPLERVEQLLRNLGIERAIAIERSGGSGELVAQILQTDRTTLAEDWPGGKSEPGKAT
jgi:hypothetical protein